MTEITRKEAEEKGKEYTIIAFDLTIPEKIRDEFIDISHNIDMSLQFQADFIESAGHTYSETTSIDRSTKKEIEKGEKLKSKLRR